MCTLTYISTAGGFILTSNRDESRYRKTFPPVEVEHGRHKLFYPKDALAGGTWIACSSSGKAASLMNGAFVKHQRRPNYSRSRGLILLEFFDHPNAEMFVSKVDVDGVEPFTMVMADSGGQPALSVVRWDEKQLHLEKLDPSQHYIWSSTPLYDPGQRAEREKWFKQWLRQHDQDSDHNILQFHKGHHTDDATIDLIMERGDILRTVSVTQVINAGREISMTYEDLQTGQKAQQSTVIT